MIDPVVGVVVRYRRLVGDDVVANEIEGALEDEALAGVRGEDPVGSAVGARVEIADQNDRFVGDEGRGAFFNERCALFLAR